MDPQNSQGFPNEGVSTRVFLKPIFGWFAREAKRKATIVQSPLKMAYPFKDSVPAF